MTDFTTDFLSKWRLAYFYGLADLSGWDASKGVCRIDQTGPPWGGFQYVGGESGIINAKIKIEVVDAHFSDLYFAITDRVDTVYNIKESDIIFKTPVAVQNGGYVEFDISQSMVSNRRLMVFDHVDYDVNTKRYSPPQGSGAFSLIMPDGTSACFWKDIKGASQFCS